MKNRQIMMSLQSPTTLLSSIQQMKNKLRTDKQLLLDIRCDFTKIHNKAHRQQYKFKEYPQEKGKKCVQTSKDERQSHSIDNNHKNRIMQLKKQHKRELLKTQERHEREMEEMIKQKDKQMEDLDDYYRKKLQEQCNYICLLEEQTCSPIQSQRDKISQEQYQSVINQLLQENNRLHQQNNNLKCQLQRSSKNNHEQYANGVARNRFKFAKLKKQQSNMCLNSSVSNSNFMHKRHSSVYYYNKQNIDSSNRKQWQDGQILDQSTSLKTIICIQNIFIQYQDNIKIDIKSKSKLIFVFQDVQYSFFFNFSAYQRNN